MRRIPIDERYRMRADALAAAIAEDRAAGWLPFCVVATLGTTSSTTIDPTGGDRRGLRARAAVAPRRCGLRRRGARSRPSCGRSSRGWERADSIVVNPHKWMFTPFDASLLLFRRPEVFRDAFSLVPDYLAASGDDGAHNFNEYGIQLGRRFRALKLWIMIRHFGTEGFAARIREHCRMAQELAGWIAADADWELLAPVPLSTVCFRWHPRTGGAGPGTISIGSNQAILDAVNRSGRIYLSATRLGGRFTLRVSIGNPRANLGHVETCWALLRQAAASLPVNPERT